MSIAPQYLILYCIQCDELCTQSRSYHISVSMCTVQVFMCPMNKDQDQTEKMDLIHVVYGCMKIMKVDSRVLGPSYVE